MADADLDSRVRARAFQFLREQTELHGGEVLPRGVLARGFEFEGQRVPLIAPQGIFKPAVLPEMPLSITTVPVVEGEDRPYDDGVGPDGLLRYRYRGTDPMHRDNQGLRLVMQRSVPLVYLVGITPGRYMPITPDRIVEIRLDILRESDGPMLQHGLQGFQGGRIHTPRPKQLWPRADLLAERYEAFRKAG